MKKGVSTIIEITNAHVKLFQFKSARNQRILSAFDVKPIHDFNDHEIVDILTSMLRSRTIQEEGLVLIVPRRQVLLKLMHLPSKNKEEITKMVELQLANKIPYALEDVSHFCYFLGEDGGGHTQVLVIVTHREVSGRYLNIFRQVGIHVSRFALSSFGILQWLEYQKSKKQITHDEAVALVDIDIENSEICFCHKGKLLFSRSFDAGARNLSKDHVFQIIKQIDLSLGVYQKENIGPPIEEIIVLSTLDQKELLREKIEENFQISTKTFTSIENVSHQKNMKLSVLKEQPGISLSAGFGLGLTDISNTLNLIPQMVTDAKQGKVRKSQLVKFIFLLALACTLGISILGVELYNKINYLGQLKEEVKIIKPRARGALQKMQFIQSFNEEFGKRILISDVFHELYALTPKEISFRLLSVNGAGRLTIEGFAQTQGSINNFQATLVKSPKFKDVNLVFATKRKIFQSEVTNFKIESQLIDTGNATND